MRKKDLHITIEDSDLEDIDLEEINLQEVPSAPSHASQHKKWVESLKCARVCMFILLLIGLAGAIFLLVFAVYGLYSLFDNVDPP